jgi:uncharacterized membrane protein
MKGIILTLAYLLWALTHSMAQCPNTNNINQGNCNAGQSLNSGSNVTIGPGNNRNIPVNSNVNISNLTITGGNLVVCGNLVINGLNMNNNSQTSITVNPGASLTINSTNVNLNGNVTIANYGIFIFNGNMTLQNQGNVLFNASSGQMTFNNGTLMLQGNNGQNHGFLNEGVVSVNNLTQQNNGTLCMGTDAAIQVNGTWNVLSSSRSVIFNGSNPSVNASSSCVSVGGTLNLQRILTDSPISICLANGATENVTGSGGYGNATVQRNCSGCAQLLPVTLLSFRAFPSSLQVELRWEIGNGSTFEAFQVEKSSDGRDFRATGNPIASHGRAYERTTFNYTDLQPASYYRLRIIDVDGTFAFSPVIAIPNTQFSANNPLTLFPNPATSVLQYALQTTDEQVTIEVLNMVGQVVFRETQGNRSGEVIGLVSLDGFEPGAYLFRVNSRAFHKVQKFLIAK